VGKKWYCELTEVSSEMCEICLFHSWETLMWHKLDVAVIASAREFRNRWMFTSVFQKYWLSTVWTNVLGTSVP